MKYVLKKCIAPTKIRWLRCWVISYTNQLLPSINSGWEVYFIVKDKEHMYKRSLGQASAGVKPRTLRCLKQKDCSYSTQSPVKSLKKIVLGFPLVVCYSHLSLSGMCRRKTDKRWQSANDLATSKRLDLGSCTMTSDCFLKKKKRTHNRNVSHFQSWV